MSRAIFPAPAVAFEVDQVEGHRVGRDPRHMSPAELTEVGHSPAPILRLIREKCLDCCGGQPSEVRRCTAIGCALWPLRMSHNPWHRRGPSGQLAGSENLPSEGDFQRPDALGGGSL